jgi:hypothetical protein
MPESHNNNVLQDQLIAVSAVLKMTFTLSVGVHKLALLTPPLGYKFILTDVVAASVQVVSGNITVTTGIMKYGFTDAASSALIMPLPPLTGIATNGGLLTPIDAPVSLGSAQIFVCVEITGVGALGRHVLHWGVTGFYARTTLDPTNVRWPLAATEAFGAVWPPVDNA